MSDSKVVPFGKYKGQPLEILKEDPQYCEWMTSQPWFGERFPELRTIIVNNFTEPTCTPEHNKLQARFMDSEFVDKFADFMSGTHSVSTVTTSVEWCGDGKEPLYDEQKHQRENPKDWKSVITKYRWVKFEFDGVDVLVRGGSVAIAVEIKPLIGDDYPAVMRDILSKCTIDGSLRYTCMVLIYGRFRSDAIDEVTMKAFFRNRQILAFSFDEVDAFGVTSINVWDS